MIAVALTLRRVTSPSGLFLKINFVWDERLLQDELVACGKRDRNFSEPQTKFIF